MMCAAECNTFLVGVWSIYLGCKLACTFVMHYALGSALSTACCAQVHDRQEPYGHAAVCRVES